MNRAGAMRQRPGRGAPAHGAGGLPRTSSVAGFVLLAHPADTPRSVTPLREDWIGAERTQHGGTAVGGAKLTISAGSGE